MRRRLIAVACACVLPASAAISADAPKGADGQTPAQAAAEDMMVMYEDLCLNQFPDLEALGNDLAARKAVPLDAATTNTVLLGHPGTAWTVAGTLGKYTFALEMPPARRCVVTGKAAEDEGVRTVFATLVTSYGKAHEFGNLQAPPVQSGKVGGAPATLQIIAAAPDGRSRQAFVNMGVTNPDGTSQLRLAREMAPK
jgi:hypothetical protein